MLSETLWKWCGPQNSGSSPSGGPALSFGPKGQTSGFKSWLGSRRCPDPSPGAAGGPKHTDPEKDGEVRNRWTREAPGQPSGSGEERGAGGEWAEQCVPRGGAAVSPLPRQQRAYFVLLFVAPYAVWLGNTVSFPLGAASGLPETLLALPTFHVWTDVGKGKRRGLMWGILKGQYEVTSNTLCMPFSFFLFFFSFFSLLPWKEWMMLSNCICKSDFCDLFDYMR